ncbi:MAG: Cell envelope-related transcriptional attenuator [Candidatus Magasanikbacteria bacterium GW2011_GWC2_45_8]|uniref:Cell envelope-related transcriptional attenuator n=1 Tax=Candidatus Magasanikbacteria bacterium GW2011_GWC2_45_8 TaxID=1619050 RepID=A0A0G1N044_9BACT|nr:MAG: Cell envelope-related transcriptional attenuator [Candidatus Magasanikbacteria bacterium GW2011_GWC2_45_8]
MLIKQVRSLILSNDRDINGQQEDRINILLFGIGGEGHDGAFLTDTIILASIKPSTKQLALISIPRDLIVPIPGGYGYRKINSADSYGEEIQKGHGAEFAASVVEQVFALPIHYYARVDFKAFKEVIDRVGGVEVYIDRDFSDSLFPTDDYKYRTVSFKKGLQTLNGQDALDFARSRHGNNNEGSDFARARRQQKILLALKDKLLSVNTIFNPNKISDIVGSLQRNISTDIEWWETAQLYKMAKNLDYENVTMRVISAENNGPLVESMLGDAFVLQARDQNFGELRRIVQNIFDDHSAQTEQLKNTTQPSDRKPTVFIQNGTWVLGLAGEYKSQLERKGIVTGGVGNAIVRNRKQTAVYGSETQANKSIVETFEKLLGAPVERIPNPAPAELFTDTTESSADIIIILGADSDHPLNP